MNRNIPLLLLSLLAVAVLSSPAFATTIYNTRQDITSKVGGSVYWAANLTPGSGTAPQTRVRQNSSGSNFYKPGLTSSQASLQITNQPVGYGWATDFLIPGDVPPGMWTFQIFTSNNQNGSSGYVGVNVFSTCASGDTRLFYAQGTTNVAGSTSRIGQNFTAIEPAFNISGCRLKFEYWLTIGPIDEGTNTNTLLNVSTNLFSITFPTPVNSTQGNQTGNQTQGGNQTDNQTFGNQTQFNMTCTPGSNITCSSNVGACRQGIQICQADGTWGACSGILPSPEVCNGIDDDCDGVIDNNVTYKDVTCGVGACQRTVTQACVNGSFTPACVPGPPSPEVCNGLDNDCDGVVGNGLPTKTVTCGVGACQRTVVQSCANGAYTPACVPGPPSPEICDGIDNDCDGKVDSGDVCIQNVAPPCEENWSCSDWTACIGANFSTRTCVDNNACNTTARMPAGQRSCFALLANETGLNPKPGLLSSDDALTVSFLLIVGLFLGAGILVSKQKKKADVNETGTGTAQGQEGKAEAAGTESLQALKSYFAKPEQTGTEQNETQQEQKDNSDQEKSGKEGGQIGDGQDETGQTETEKGADSEFMDQEEGGQL